MKLHIVNTLDENIWREFVYQHPNGNIFHTPEMYHVFESSKGNRPHLWAALNDHGELLSFFSPIEVTLKNGIFHRFTTRFIAYGSALCTLDRQGNEALSILLVEYSKETQQEGLYTELRHLSDPSAILPVLDLCGYKYEEHLDYIIDLSKTEKELWQAISKNGRKSIRKFHNRGVIPEEIRDRSLIPIFYDLLKQTYKRVGVPLGDISLFEAIFDILVPKGMAKMMLARANDNYIAASLEIPYKEKIYSWYSGYDREWRSFYPNDGLVWYILEWGANNGYRYFDFGGAGRSDNHYTVRDFKAKYGGQLVNYGRHILVHDRFILVASQITYQIYKTLIRFSPH